MIMTRFEEIAWISEEIEKKRVVLNSKLLPYIERLKQYHKIVTPEFNTDWVTGSVAVESTRIVVELFYWSDYQGTYHLPYWFINMNDEEFKQSMDNLAEKKAEEAQEKLNEKLSKKEEENYQLFLKLKERYKDRFES